MLLPPFFLGPSEDDVRRHISRVAEGTSLPIVVQYAPALTGVKMTAESYLDLNRRAPNFRYVKVESAPPRPLISSIAEGSGGTMNCLVGYGGVQLVDGLRRGAVGVQPASFRASRVTRRLQTLPHGPPGLFAFQGHGELE